MIQIHVLISAEGVHCAEVESNVNDVDRAKQFYTRLKPVLKDVDQTIRSWRSERNCGEEAP